MTTGTAAPTYDPQTGEIADDWTWETTQDGSRVRRPPTAEERAATAPKRKRRTAAEGAKGPSFAAGTWRWDVDEDGQRYRRLLTQEEIAERDRAKTEHDERSR
jgi:hypothetical protein